MIMTKTFLKFSFLNLLLACCVRISHSDEMDYTYQLLITDQSSLFSSPEWGKIEQDSMSTVEQSFEKDGELDNFCPIPVITLAQLKIAEFWITSPPLFNPYLKDYTLSKASRFLINENYQVVNEQGFSLQYTPYNLNPHLATCNFFLAGQIKTLNLKPYFSIEQPTTKITLEMDLPGWTDLNHTLTNYIPIYDHLGTCQILTLNWEKIDLIFPDQIWHLKIDTITGGAVQEPYKEGVKIRFGGTGLPISFGGTSVMPPLEIIWNNGSYMSRIVFDIGMAHMFATLTASSGYDVVINKIVPNGGSFKYLTQVNIKKNGEVELEYGKNMTSQIIGCVPVAAANKGFVYKGNTSSIKQWDETHYHVKFLSSS